MIGLSVVIVVAVLQVRGSLPLLPGGGGHVVAHACVDFFFLVGSNHDRSSSCHLILVDDSLPSGPNVAFHAPLGHTSPSAS
jgi:hypothetical protein